MAASTCGLDDAELVLAIWCRSMGSTGRLDSPGSSGARAKRVRSAIRQRQRAVWLLQADELLLLIYGCSSIGA